MMTQMVVWTLLPDPAASGTTGTAELSLVLSPRLSTTEGGGGAVLPLSSYPDVATWPSFAYGIVVEFVSEQGRRTARATFADADPDAALWKAIFPLGTQVQPYRFDPRPATDPIVSYPGHLLLQSLRQQYSQLYAPEATAGDGSIQPTAEGGGPPPPPQWDLADRLALTVGAGEGSQLGVEPLAQALREGVVPDDLAEDPDGWVRFADFHQPGDRSRDEEPPPPGPAGSGGEFHSLVASLADHPGLLARLGLVRRLKVPLPTGLAGVVKIRAFPEHDRPLDAYAPFTRCVVSAGRLVLARHDGAAGALHLPLDDTATYTAVDVDVDAAGFGLQSYAAMLRQLPRTESAPQLSAPALRSDGIFVTEKNRQMTFHQLLRQAASMDSDLKQGHDGRDITLHADNVQLGFRVDVYDEGSGRWYPLCRRTGSYTVKGLSNPLPIDDEGTVSDVIAAASTTGGAQTYRLHQSLFRWRGWSLVARPPGKMLGLKDELAEPGPVQDPALPFVCTVTPAPGTLPSLRYGRSYRFRARLVDLAGRSLPFDPRPVAGEPATRPLRYARYEPVPSPVLVPRRAVTQGESVTVLVVRTDNSDPASPVPGPTCERHLLPPKAAVLLLERHGVLDVPRDHRTDPAVHSLLHARDGGVVTGTPDPGAGGTPYVNADTMALPWLPDPLSRGFVLRGLPGASDVQVEWPQGAAWNERLPLRVIVEPATTSAGRPVVVDLAARQVRVKLAPGTSVATVLSSLLRAGDEEVMGLWRWYVENTDPTDEDRTERRADALAGRAAQLTPPTDLSLIHAVRCPVDPPAFTRAAVQRRHGETAYVLDDPAVAVHAGSTLSVHTEATWTDTVDDLSQPGPTTVTGRAVLRHEDEGGPTAAEIEAADSTTAIRARHDLADTRHHVVTYTPIGTSRFAAYFTERRSVVLSGTTPVSVARAFVPGTVVVRADVPVQTPAGTPAEPGATYSPESDVEIDHAGGTVARRAAGTIPNGAVVQVSFVAPPVVRAGAPKTLHVKSSAPPPAPVVHSVVPAFAWKEQRTSTSIVSTRFGGIIRVYLERPWYVTGEGEMLGVLVVNEGAGVDAATGEWASRWGRDPLHRPEDSPVLPGRAPWPSDLVRGTEVPFFIGRAMGHAVEYDPQRRLWFADIEFRHHGLYEPFVQLRVARLQPEALLGGTDPPREDLRLSSRVEAGFIKLPADRRTILGVDGTRVTVTVIGPTPPRGQDAGPPSEITATVQVRSTGADDDLAWTDFSSLVPLAAEATPPGSFGRWKGTVTLPGASGTRPMRVLIREFERRPGPDGSPTRRICYFDTVTL